MVSTVSRHSATLRRTAVGPGVSGPPGGVHDDHVAVRAQHLGHGVGVEQIDAGDVHPALILQPPRVRPRVHQGGRGHAERGERADDR